MNPKQANAPAKNFRDEYRDAAAIERAAAAIKNAVTKSHTIMEICGGQTHAIMKFGLDTLLPAEVRLIHGPGCPVCVTPIERIDMAIALAKTRGVILTSFGDMLRVPGSAGDLLAAKAEGADVRIVYSPLDAVKIARENPRNEVIFFSVGFETTAPATAMAAFSGAREGVGNFSLLVSHVLVPPAIEAILSAPDSQVNGFLAAGHVCTVMGVAAYEPLAQKYRVPIVVTGFEPVDILLGVLECVTMLEAGDARVENRYARAVRSAGNEAAQKMVATVFEVVRREWRGMGEIPASGLGLRAAFENFDAERRFAGAFTLPAPNPLALECRAGEVLQGKISPDACPAFGTRCTPERPLGAPMVSSEGACAAYYRYRRS